MSRGDGVRSKPLGQSLAADPAAAERLRWLSFALPLAGLWLAVLLIGIFDFGKGWQRSLAYSAVLLGLLLLRRSTAPLAAAPGWLRRAAVAVSILAAAWHVVVFVAESPKRIEIDVASTTIAAGDLMFQGRNPYRIAIDYRPEITARVNVHAFKYGPMMAVAYRPFVVVFDENGVRIANLVLDALTAILIYALARRLAGATAAIVALALYLSFATVPQLLYAEPFNDLVAVIPLGVAFLLAGTRPFALGLLAGLSVSAKLLPGVVFLPFLLPEGARARVLFCTGLGLGLLPLAAYAAMSPPDFVGNMITFNFLREVDTTSWMFGLPDWVPRAAKVVVGLIAVICAAVAVSRPRLLTWRDRMLLAVVCTILVTLAGFGVRRNYVLWWLPFATVLAAGHAANYAPRRAERLSPIGSWRESV